MKTFFKILALFFAILFAWAAILQNNDPDALVWYGIYGLAALSSFLFAMGRLPFLATLVLGLSYLLGGFLSWPETFQGFEIGEGEIENIERGREACGLLIVSVVFWVYALRMRYITAGRK